MKTFIVTIKPESSFGTPLKGDTLFGQFCWQAVHDDSLMSGGFDRWIREYTKRPFAVFSSAFPVIYDEHGKPVIYLPCPSMPTSSANGSRMERVKKRKSDKKKKWVPVPVESMQIDAEQMSALTDEELFDSYLATLGATEKRMFLFLHDKHRKPIIQAPQTHNSINRLTMTTGPGFDPYVSDNFTYLPGLKLGVIAGIDEDAMDMNALKTGMERIGMFGFGRDASTGLGRFAVTDVAEAGLPPVRQRAAYYTLAPSVPEKGKWKEHFAMPFTRFGRHGAEMVLSGKPFKNPVVMADEGAVFIPEEDHVPDRPYIGSAVTDLSLAEPGTVAQGYSLYLPFVSGEVYER